MKIRNGVRVPDERATAMMTLFTSGSTMQEIGNQFGVTKQYVSQLLKACGVSVKAGGCVARKAAKGTAKAAKADAVSIAKHGLTVAQHRALRALGRKLMRAGQSRDRSPIGAFCRQRQNAKERGIEWHLKLGEWWKVWQDSGHWDERGRGEFGHVMSRKGDTGAYAPENVFIQPAVDNNSNTPHRKSKLPRGVRSPKDGQFSAMRMVNSKRRYLGTFDTPEEAHEAYLAAATRCAA